MLQAVVSCSKKRFQFTTQGDPIEFVSWFLNSLHLTLNGTKKKKSTVIYKTFQGEMKQWARKLPATIEGQTAIDETEYPTTESSAPFLFLTMDIPASPLFKDQLEQNAIPQVPMLSLLQKFNGTQEKEYKTYHDTTLKRFSLVKLPNYLILFVKRFNNNTFFVEKNPTIVNFPVKGLDMADFLTPEAREEHTDTVYNLVANITHEGEAGQGKGTYSLHVLHKGSKQWFDLQDLHVKEILPPMITLSESYIQIWELQKNLRPPGLGESNMDTGGE